MANDLQPISPDKAQKRVAPLLHLDRYKQTDRVDTVTREEKKKFLELFYETGNITKAARVLGRDRAVFSNCMHTDKVFAADFEAVRMAIKEDLEEVMTQNALKEKGYMDRITWLRRNYPAEYNPNYLPPDKKTESELKELAEKLKGYQIIPKEKVVETEGGEVKEEKEDAV